MSSTNALLSTQIKFGTVIKIWHGSRGHDYVFCGIDKDSNSALLLKNNCINKDGSIHASTKRFHKRLTITKLGKKMRHVTGVSSVMGERVSADPKVMLNFLTSLHNFKKVSLPKQKTAYSCAANFDHRVDTNFE